MPTTSPRSVSMAMRLIIVAAAVFFNYAGSKAFQCLDHGFEMLLILPPLA